MYTYLVDQYLFYDREADLSLLLWGMQLFPVPAIATAAVKDMDILHTLLQVLTSYFTEQFEQQHLRIPPAVVPRIDADVEVLRTKKWQTMFGHLKLILQSKGVQELLLDQHEAFNEVISFISLFTGMIPHIRAVEEHVEYESDSWIRALSATIDLSRVTTSLGQVFEKASRSGLIRAITEVGLHISYNCRLLSPVLDSEKFSPPTQHAVSVFGKTFDVISFDIDTEWVSIHNPLHWTLAEAIRRIPLKHDPGSSVSSRRDVIAWVTASSPDVADPLLTFNLQITLESPLRTVAHLAQVRAGLWVRNGIAMRGQLHHYRDHPLRETTYDQDLFLLQFGFCTLDPAVMLAGMIDRFGLTDMFTLQPWTLEMENPQFLQLLEELLLCLIVMFTETWSMTPHTRAETTRREIIHLLALQPMSFSDLVKRLSERTVEIPTFKNELESVATLRDPKGVTETGVYELKDEHYDQINPLFFHYTRNQQNSAYESLCKRRKVEVIDIMAPPLPEDNLVFSHLLDIFETPYIVLTVFVVLHNCISIRNRGLSEQMGPVPQLDGLIDLAFHLATLAVSCAPVQTARSFCETFEGIGSEPLLQQLCEIEMDKDWTPYRPRVSNLIDLISKQEPDKVRMLRTRTSRDQPSKSAEEARKEAIAKRKQAIMAGFAKNQVAFAEANLMGQDDSDEDIIEEGHPYGQCIVCQEPCTDFPASGMLAIVQPSKAVRNMCVGRDWLEECLRVPETLDGDTRRPRFGFGQDHRLASTDAYPRTEQRFGLNITGCGHIMHETCLSHFFNDTRWRQHQQGQRNHPENVFRQEFVCPLCKSVGNMLVPLNTMWSQATGSHTYLPLNDWIRKTLDEDLRRKCKRPSLMKTHPLTGERLTLFTELYGEADMDFLQETDANILVRYVDLVIEIAKQTTHLSGRTEKGLYVPKDVVGYTLSMMEIAQRGIALPEGSQHLNETSKRMLQGLITLLWQEEQTTTGQPADYVMNRITFFAALLPDRFRTRTTSSALLLRDPLCIVIEAAALAPDALQPIMVLCYYVEVIRAMLTITFWARLCLSRPVSPIWADSAAGTPEYENSTQMFPEPRNLILGCFRHTPQLLQEATAALSLLPERDLSKLLYTFTLPFLRRCSMLGSAMNLEFPTAGAASLFGGGEYGQHLRRLKIPFPARTILDNQQPIHSSIATWLKQWLTLETGVPTLEYPGIYELYRLPNSLESILKYYEKKKCDKCNKVPNNPAVCLFCGEYLCLGTDCCAEQGMGECNLHRME